jgi:hypothetical protein
MYFTSGSSLGGYGSIFMLAASTNWVASNLSSTSLSNHAFNFGGQVFVQGDSFFPSDSEVALTAIGGFNQTRGVFPNIGSQVFRLDLDTGNVFSATLGNGNNSITQIDPQTGRAATYTVFLTQPASGAKGVLTSVPWTWVGGVPSLQAVNGAVDMVTVVTPDGTNFYGTLAPQVGIRPVGAMVFAGGSALKTLAVTPTAVGNVLVLAVGEQNTAAGITAVSGGGVTTWTKLISALPGNPPGCAEIWFGTITTAGSATVTITTTAANWIALNAQEFTIGRPATWTADGSGAASVSTSAATSGNYPSVTPAASAELYVGFAAVWSGAISGSTAGVTYVPPQNGTQLAYETVPSTAPISPAWASTSSSVWAAASGLLVAA